MVPTVPCGWYNKGPVATIWRSSFGVNVLNLDQNKSCWCILFRTNWFHVVLTDPLCFQLVPCDWDHEGPVGTTRRSSFGFRFMNLGRQKSYWWILCGTNWFFMVSTDPLWYQLIPCGTNWYLIVPTVPVWYQLIPYGLKTSADSDYETSEVFGTWRSSVQPIISQSYRILKCSGS